MERGIMTLKIGKAFRKPTLPDLDFSRRKSPDILLGAGGSVKRHYQATRQHHLLVAFFLNGGSIPWHPTQVEPLPITLVVHPLLFQATASIASPGNFMRSYKPY
jgi:hypothetical protein